MTTKPNRKVKAW